KPGFKKLVFRTLGFERLSMADPRVRTYGLRLDFRAFQYTPTSPEDNSSMVPGSGVTANGVWDEPPPPGNPKNGSRKNGAMRRCPTDCSELACTGRAAA